MCFFMILHCTLAKWSLPEWLVEDQPHRPPPGSGAMLEWHQKRNTSSVRTLPVNGMTSRCRPFVPAERPAGPTVSYATRAPTLVIGIHARVSGSKEQEELAQCLCSIHTFHPDAHAHVVVASHSSPSTKHLQVMLATMKHEGRSTANVVLCKAGEVCMMRTLGMSLAFAASRNSTYFAFIKQHVRIVQPLQFQRFPCDFTSFQVLRHASSKDANESERLALRRAFLGDDSRTIAAAREADGIERVPLHGFVCSKDCLEKLDMLLNSPQASPLRRIIGIQLSNGSSTCDEGSLEKALAAMAVHRLASPLLPCNLAARTLSEPPVADSHLLRQRADSPSMGASELNSVTLLPSANALDGRCKR